MSRQMYKIKQEIANHDRAALEVEWVGTLAVPFGSIPAGQRKALFPVFLEFWEGKIVRQRSGTTTVSRPGSKRDGKMGF